MAELVTKLVYESDDSSRKKAIKGLEDISKAQAQLNKANDGIAKSSAKAAGSLALIDKQGLTKAPKNAQNLTSELEKAGNAADDLDTRLKRLDDDFGLISQQVGQAGDIESSIRAIGGAAGTIPGGGAINSVVGGGAEIFAVLEAAPRLNVAFKGLPDILQKTAQTSSSFTATIATGLTPALGATGASIAAISAVALPLVAIVGALSFALGELGKRNAEAAEATKRAAEARQAAIDIERDFADLDSTSQVEERNRLFEESATLAEKLRGENEELARLRDLVDNSGPLEARINGTRDQLNAQQTVVNDLIAASALANANLETANSLIADLSEEELNRANNAQALATIEEQLKQTEADRVQTTTQLEQSQSRIAQIEQQRTQLIEQRAQAEAFAAQNEALDRKFAQEDQAAQNVALYEELEAIAANGKDKLVAIENSLAEARTERASAISDIVAKGNDKVADINAKSGAKLQEINQEYFKKQIDATDKFRTQTERIESDNKKARLRLLADITDSLNDAQRDNNVIAFLNAQREGARKLQEQSQDAGESERRRVEDFTTQQEEAAQAQQARIAEIQEAQRVQVAEVLANVEAEKQKVIESYAEREAAIAEARQAEIAAIAEAKQAAIDRYNETEEREAQAADRQRQREELRDQQEEARFQEQLAKIDETKQAEIARLTEVQTALQGIADVTANLNRQRDEITTQSQVPRTSQVTDRSIGNSSGGGIFGMLAASAQRLQQSREAALGLRRGGGIAFASGGIVNQPTLGLMGEVPGMSEALIPFRQSEGLQSALARNGIGGGQPVSISVSMPVTVGDIATASMVNREIASATETILRDGIAKVFMQALNPQ